MGKGGQIKLNESRPMRVNNKKMARLQRNDCMEETNALFSCIAVRLACSQLACASDKNCQVQGSSCPGSGQFVLKVAVAAVPNLCFAAVAGNEPVQHACMPER